MGFLDRKWRSIVAMTLVYAPGVAARSWWSIDIPALDAIHNDDPLFALSSQLAMEDSTFLYGAFGLAESTIKLSSTNSKPRTPSSPSLTTYSTPTPVLLTETYIPSLEPSPEPFDNLSNAPTIKSSVQMVSGLHAPTNAPHVLTMSHEDSPTVSPTISQTSFPTWSPSTHYQAANGSCPPNEKLHRLTLYDAYRDGWGGSTELVIKRNAGSDATIFQGGMNEESEEEFYLCLNPNVCYSANVNGGAFLEEVSWEIRRVELATGQSTETVAKGVGEGGSCDFGLNDVSTSCITTCDGMLCTICICTILLCL